MPEEKTLFNLLKFESTFADVLSEHTSHIPRPLRDAILYSAHTGGKRIRPRMLISIGSILGVDEKILSSLASSVELIHTYTLIHDDLPCMDNDDFRRGKPTNHIVYGEDTALLAGDALMALSIDLLLDLKGKPGVNPLALLDALQATSHAMGGKGVIAGQVEEKSLLENPSFTKLLDVFRKKTGALFALAYSLPATFTTLDPDSRKRLFECGEALGTAFQIADDLEDPMSQTPPSPIHVRAYLTDLEAIRWVEEAKQNACATPATQAFTDGLFQDILEKCQHAKK